MLWRALVLAVVLPGTRPAVATTLSDPAVDSYNVRIGTQTFAGLYQFTTNTLLVETAQAINALGSDIIKMYLGTDFPRQYHLTLTPNITNLITLARDQPSCRRTLDMPFRRLIAWAYPFGNPDAPFHNGYNPTEGAADYREMYDLTRYLLTNYNKSGKIFYLGHWEGDGYFIPWTTNPSPTAIQGMIDWQNNRQKAVDDAKRATTYSNVNVYYYAEANRVRDAMLNGSTNNQRMINQVVPYLTNLDFLSYSSYDAMNLGTTDLYATLDYMESMLPTNKAGSIKGERLWIGEYGWGGSLLPDQQEPVTRAYLQRLLNYGRQALPHILFWEIYNNEPNKAFCLIDSNNVKSATYYLHARFINGARLAIARFKERSGRLPTDSEFVSLVSPTLNQPLPAQVNLSVSNLGATLLSGTSARLSGTIAQGVYGADCATVWVFYGPQDGGISRGAWAQRAQVGLNTNFNPAMFVATVTNMTPNSNYFYRFYATNAGGEAWAPASATLTTQALHPSDFGSHLRITFAGYSRAEALVDFPVLVHLSTNLSGFSYRQFASTDGRDLRFADANGLMPLSYEIDEWNTNGTSYVWVRVPQVSSTNDFIWAYWGNPLAGNLPASSTNGAVWAPDHYLVWHLKEKGFPFADSAQQHPAFPGVAPVSAPGMAGRGCAFDGVSQYLNAGRINVGTAFTLSAWVKVDPAASDIQTIWANKPGGWNGPGFALYVNTYQTSDAKLLLETGNGSTGLTASTGPNLVTPGQWHRVSTVVDESAGTALLYVDGVDATANSAIRTDFANQTGINLGRFTNGAFFLKGVVDEARIQARVRSPAWEWASWMTESASSTLASYSPVRQLTPTISVAASNGAVLTWPASGVGFQLYTTTNLVPPVSWTRATNGTVLVADQWQITLPPDGSVTRFFRLQSE